MQMLFPDNHSKQCVITSKIVKGLFGAFRCSLLVSFFFPYTKLSGQTALLGVPKNGTPIADSDFVILCIFTDWFQAVGLPGISWIWFARSLLSLQLETCHISYLVYRASGPAWGTWGTELCLSINCPKLLASRMLLRISNYGTYYGLVMLGQLIHALQNIPMLTKRGSLQATLLERSRGSVSYRKGSVRICYCY